MNDLLVACALVAPIVAIVMLFAEDIATWRGRRQ